LDSIADVMAPRSVDLKTLIIRIISYELVQPIRLRYRQTDVQTDGRLTVAIRTRFALIASRGKNSFKLSKLSLK